ncbi:MAG: universal stress protein, partial [Candidatus Sedimenticola endophacoides]
LTDVDRDRESRSNNCRSSSLSSILTATRIILFQTKKTALILHYLRRGTLYGSPFLVEVGVPKREIVRVAQEHGADLIVLGSHGRHGLQLLLGSTASGVLHLAGCDVLAVRIGSA